MIWLREIRGEAFVKQNVIFVLYRNGPWQRFDDTWTPDQPESDPAFIPPAGLYQPIRGFGKLWRENVGVREQLGWALAPEQGYQGAWQQPIRESIPSAAYLCTIAHQIVQLYGWETGNWDIVKP
jgi:hypothetical protein